MRSIAVALALAAAATALSGCGSAKRLQLAWVGAGAAEGAQYRAIRSAQKGNPALSIFPAHPSTRTCLIPNGISSLHGSCETTARIALEGHEYLQILTFTERWKNHGHYSWVVSVAPPTTLNGRPIVVATHTRGQIPPQAND